MSKTARGSTRGGPAGRRPPKGEPGTLTGGPTFETADRLHSAAIHLLRRVRREDRAAGLPAPQLSALSVIVFRGPLTLGALAEAEQVRPPTMTRVVTALEQAGLVERRIHETDRRVVLVQATLRGQEVLAEGRLRRVRALAEALGELPERDLRRLTGALEVLEKLVGMGPNAGLRRKRS